VAFAIRAFDHAGKTRVPPPILSRIYPVLRHVFRPSGTDGVKLCRIRRAASYWERLFGSVLQDSYGDAQHTSIYVLVLALPYVLPEANPEMRSSIAISSSFEEAAEKATEVI
jgi:hypothetical protein